MQIYSPLQEKYPVFLSSILDIKVLCLSIDSFTIMHLTIVKSVLSQSPQEKKELFFIISLTDIFINALEIYCSDIEVYFFIYFTEVLFQDFIKEQSLEYTRTLLHIMHNVENCQAFIEYVYHFLM